MVDTAGHSVRNTEQRTALENFIKVVQAGLDTDVFLVLSATTKYKDLLEVADTYKKLFDYRLIFTKMDETSAAGNLYNLRRHTGASMSYITNGQNVPDDIEAFDSQKIVKSILGGSIL
jgi:flagellar biosynthesis protein FlhF